MKIKDRVLLGIISGFTGNIVKTIMDEALLSKKISKRSFRTAAAGVWVNKKSEATNLKGQVLGGLLDFGMAAVGGIGIVHLLSKTGRDYALTKGVLSGITLGSTITALLGALTQNGVKPKDAMSNLSYMATHAVYGAVTSIIITKLGDSSLFDSEPLNNYLSPAKPTTEERKIKVTQN
ncbi:hypothetical protein [Desulfotruncus alcoholivorax]|uniref:hypothetical protein n=1 Tax=Desulfotruncus alcoholivorax TaxID=265477 RepID=UPI000410E554|nr:hypothetical protein [Desulfotruncus alcoholivorax]